MTFTLHNVKIAQDALLMSFNLVFHVPSLGAELPSWYRECGHDCGSRPGMLKEDVAEPFTSEKR